MAYTYCGKDIYKQLEQVIEKLDKLTQKSEVQAMTIINLNATIKELNNTIQAKDEKINELIKEIERLKNNNNKDSSNSSKPSSTNGFKKVITNNREKTNRKRGGQKNHKGTTLTSDEIEEMIKDGKIDEVITVEENKTEFNKNLKPIIMYEFDLKITKIVTKHIIYPDANTKLISSPVYYGNNIKIINNLLGMKNMSMDGIQSFISDVTNGIMNISKGTLYSWNKSISDCFSKTEYEYIKEQLLNSLVVHVDESPIKINGEQYYIHNISNGTHTLQYVSKTRGKKAVEEFAFLTEFKGILIHDHYSMYYSYGTDHAECNVHVLRYLNGVDKFTNHEWANELKELFIEMKNRKEELLVQEINKLEDDEYRSFESRYLNILAKGKKESLKDLKTNAYSEEERNLLNRLKRYVQNHLLFIKKFFVPFSNNRAEVDLRPIKIKQKIGKFRSIEGANIYTITKSCLSTYSKNGISLYSSLEALLNNKPILI